MSTQGYYQTAVPIAVPAKNQYAQYYTPQPATYGVSPPEAAESVTTGSGITHSGYSAASSSYAGSASGGDYESSASASGVDMHEYMQDRFANAFDPLPLDRTLAVQAQT